MKVKNEAPEYELLDEDTYPARCVGVYDLGRQDGNFGIAHMVWLSFEVIDEEKEDGTPFVLGRSLSVKFSSRSDLGKILKRWLGIVVARDEEFDFEELLDRAAMITVEHSEENDDGNVYANITQIGKVPKGMKVGKATIEPQILTLTKKGFDKDVFDDLPEFLQKKIKNSEDWKLIFGKGKSRDDDDDDEEDDDDAPKKKSSKKKARDEDDDDEDDKSKKKKKSSKVVDEDDDDDDNDEEEKKSKKSSKRKSKDADEDDDDDEDDAPKKRKGKRVVDDDDEEEDDDDRPRKRSSKLPKKKR